MPRINFEEYIYDTGTIDLDNTDFSNDDIDDLIAFVESRNSLVNAGFDTDVQNDTALDVIGRIFLMRTKINDQGTARIVKYFVKDEHIIDLSLECIKGITSEGVKTIASILRAHTLEHAQQTSKTKRKTKLSLSLYDDARYDSDSLAELFAIKYATKNFRINIFDFNGNLSSKDIKRLITKPFENCFNDIKTKAKITGGTFKAQVAFTNQQREQLEKCFWEEYFNEIETKAKVIGSYFKAEVFLKKLEFVIADTAPEEIENTLQDEQENIKSNLNALAQLAEAHYPNALELFVDYVNFLINQNHADIVFDSLHEIKTTQLNWQQFIIPPLLVSPLVQHYYAQDKKQKKDYQRILKLLQKIFPNFGENENIANSAFKILKNGSDKGNKSHAVSLASIADVDRLITTEQIQNGIKAIKLFLQENNLLVQMELSERQLLDNLESHIYYTPESFKSACNYFWHFLNTYPTATNIPELAEFNIAVGQTIAAYENLYLHPENITKYVRPVHLAKVNISHSDPNINFWQTLNLEVTDNNELEQAISNKENNGKQNAKKRPAEAISINNEPNVNVDEAAITPSTSKKRAPTFFPVPVNSEGPVNQVDGIRHEDTSNRMPAEANLSR